MYDKLESMKQGTNIDGNILFSFIDIHGKARVNKTKQT